ncbi:MAG TPA: hypothetical protein VFW96_24360 [Thermomicrobiales bacterium]|nr:hypothetical protein [Thermomicrobiales bacterium]
MSDEGVLTGAEQLRHEGFARQRGRCSRAHPPGRAAGRPGLAEPAADRRRAAPSAASIATETHDARAPGMDVTPTGYHCTACGAAFATVEALAAHNRAAHLT